MKFFGLLFLMAGAFYAGVLAVKPSVCGADCEKQLQTVSASDFNKYISDSDATIIDVRTQEEFSSGHIAGSKNADFKNTAEFERFLESLDKNKTYLIYCRSGNRSGQALKLMEEKGFTRVFNLSGGILSWQAENFPLE